MFMSFQSSGVEAWPGFIIVPPEPVVRRTAREEHARLLGIAAARRLRALERQGLQRHEDADYWKAVAPSAVRRATGLREHPSFAPLPG